MLDFIFGFERYRYEETSYLLNFNHLMIVLGVISITILLYKIVPAKNKKSIIITKILFVIIMFVNEIARMLWNYRRHLSHGYPSSEFDWISNFSFVVCAVQVWITIIVILATFFIKSNNNALVVAKHTLFGTAAVGGILSFIAPVHLPANRYFFHFLLLQTNLQHFLLLFVPLYLVKTGEIEVRFKKVWMGAYGFLVVGSIVVFVSHLTNRNFSTVLGDGRLESILPFPHYLTLKFILPFSITIVMYLIGEYIYKSKNKEFQIKEDSIITNQEKKYRLIWLIVAFITLMVIVYGPKILGADTNVIYENERALHSITAILILAPVSILTILMTYFSKKLGTNYSI